MNYTNVTFNSYCTCISWWNCIRSGSALLQPVDTTAVNEPALVAKPHENGSSYTLVKPALDAQKEVVKTAETKGLLKLM